MILSGVGGPCEGLWHLICLCEEAVDSGLEIDDRSEDATFQAPLGQLGEVPLHGVEPGARSRREVEDEAHVPAEPWDAYGALMSFRICVLTSTSCAASDAGGSFGLLASECRTGAGGTVARDQPDSNIEGEI
jgi:hypothetical protein